MSELSFEDEVDAMVRLGTEPENARRLVARRRGMNGIDPTRLEPSPTPAPKAAATIQLPFVLTIPWSELCSDNEKTVPYLQRTKGGTIIPRQKRSPRYQRSYKAIRARAQSVAGDDLLPVAGIALEIHAQVYLPGATHRNDAINFSKCTHDALEGIVYANDNQLHRVLWERAGIDIDRPRVEITIRRLVPASQRLTKAA